MKAFLKKAWLPLLVLIISLGLFKMDSFTSPFKTFTERFDAGQYFDRYSSENDEVSQEIVDKVNDTVDKVVSGVEGVVVNYDEFDWALFFLKLINKLLELLIYFTNYGFNFLFIIYMFFEIAMERENYTVTTTFGARIYLNIVSRIIALFVYLRRFLRLIIENFKLVFLSSLIYFFLSGILVTFLSEVLIFSVYYVIAAFSAGTFYLLFTVIKSILISYYLHIPVWATVLFLFIWYFFYGKARAIHRLDKNHDQLKMFAGYDLSVVTIVNGPPSIGKTRLLVNLSLASEEFFIEKLEERMLSIELSNPFINWGQYDVTRWVDEPQKGKLDIEFLNENFPEYLYCASMLYLCGSMIASVPFSIMDPYDDRFTVLMDLDWIRLKKSSDLSPLEPFKIVVWSEAEKDYNSHEDFKQVGDDGAHYWFGTFSHESEREGRIFIDYQLEAQFPKRLRGNAEWFLDIKDSRSKFPWIMAIYRLPFLLFNRLCESWIKRYTMIKHRLASNTRRLGRSRRKRFDVTLLFAWLKISFHWTSIVIDWFSQFYFTQFYIERKDNEGNTIAKLKLRVNAQDEYWNGQRLYNSTFLSQAFKSRFKYEPDFVPMWARQRRWTSFTPTKEELMLTHSYFIDKAFNSQTTMSSPQEEENYPVPQFK